MSSAVVTYLMTLSMNKSSNVVMPTYLQCIEMPIIETKFGVLHPNIFVM